MHIRFIGRYVHHSSLYSLGIQLRTMQVIHDQLSVADASAELDVLMCRPQMYSWWKLILFGGMCSASICSVSFDGSFIDSLILFPLGTLLVAIQLLSVRNELYSNVFE